MQQLTVSFIYLLDKKCVQSNDSFQNLPSTSEYKKFKI